MLLGRTQQVMLAIKREEDFMKDLSLYIDHTLLKPDATKSQIQKLIDEAIKYQFAAICVNPFWVSYCKNMLQHESVSLCTVIGFPIGAAQTDIKMAEAKQAIQDGATEIDMVINIGLVKDGMFEEVKKEIERMVQVSKEKAIVKVIIETALLTKEEIKKVSQIVSEAKADFIKTSTGFSKSGAKVEDIKLMRKYGGNEIGIKASGGIRTKDQALQMIEAGATRIGTSAGVAIVQE